MPESTNKPQKKNKRIVGLSLLGLTVAVLIVCMLKPDIVIFGTRYVLYKFFIQWEEGWVPQQGKAYGIDVSHYQFRIRWDQVKKLRFNGETGRQSKENKENDCSKEISFAIAKATEGTNSSDRYYDRNQAMIRKQGLVLGAYHVLTNTDAALQVKNYVSTSNLRKGDMRPIIDVESQLVEKHGRKEIGKKLAEMVDLLTQEYGCLPIIYSSRKDWGVVTDGELSKCPHWIAAYKTKMTPLKADIWQFSETGRVDGIRVPVDLNVICPDGRDLSELLID